VRLFAALIPPPNVLADLERFVASRRAAAREDVRWSGTEQWHVTLAFMARVQDEQLEPLRTGLAAAAAATPPLRLRVAGVGAFPRPRRARVVWAGLDGDTAALGTLAGDVVAAAATAGIDVPTGQFRGHLTLARLRTPRDVTELLRGMDGYAGPPWAADELALVRSHLGKRPGGRALHEVLTTSPLRTG